MMRVGVVGLGEAARDIHFAALDRVPFANVVAGCDPQSERRSEITGRWGVPCYDDLPTMLEAEAPDVVVIGTPPESHAALSKMSLAAGCHVICEKPFVATRAEADDVIDAARRAGRGLAVHHQFSHMPILRALIDQVRSTSQRLRFVQIWQLMNRPPWKEAGWRGELKHRTLYEAGVHLVDFAIELFDELPGAVSGTVTSTGESDRHRDAVAMITLEFPSGGVAQITQSRLSPGPRRYFEVRADTDQASLRASYGGRARLSAGLYHSTRPHLRAEFGLSGLAWSEIGHERKVLARNPRNALVHASTSLIEATLHAFSEGREPPVSGRRATDVLDVIATGYAAAENGTRLAYPTSDSSWDLGVSRCLS